jgi:hypothetical protein
MLGNDLMSVMPVLAVYRSYYEIVSAF